jgi:quercetin dioxygenase-like cupin family protein
VDDPDAPSGPWVHWVLFDLPGNAHDLPETLTDLLGHTRRRYEDFTRKRPGFGRRACLQTKTQRDETPQRRTNVPTAPTTIPSDDLKRSLTLAQPDNLPHIGLVGDTYTITVTGEDTNGRFCVIDMHIPPGGGPPPHRHDFEETFVLLEGELEATFRGKKSTVNAGDTLNIPANAPHQFHNASTGPVRMLCICSPAGQEKFFVEVGVPVATRTTPPPKLNEKEEAAFIEKVIVLAPKYRTEPLREA